MVEGQLAFSDGKGRAPLTTPLQDQLFQYRAFLEKGITKNQLDQEDPLYVKSMLAMLAAEGKYFDDKRKEKQ